MFNLDGKEALVHGNGDVGAIVARTPNIVKILIEGVCDGIPKEVRVYFVDLFLQMVAKRSLALDLVEHASQDSSVVLRRPRGIHFPESESFFDWPLDVLLIQKLKFVGKTSFVTVFNDDNVGKDDLFRNAKSCASAIKSYSHCCLGPQELNLSFDVCVKYNNSISSENTRF
jgi:hypothetical protein